MGSTCQAKGWARVGGDATEPIVGVEPAQGTHLYPWSSSLGAIYALQLAALQVVMALAGATAVTGHGLVLARGPAAVAVCATRGIVIQQYIVAVPLRAISMRAR